MTSEISVKTEIKDVRNLTEKLPNAESLPCVVGVWRRNMNKLIEDFAVLSGLRDREVLDMSLAQLVHDLVRPQNVVIHRRVGEGVDVRWLTTASCCAGRDQELVDTSSVPFESLPGLASLPFHARCLHTGEMLELPDPLPTCLYPLSAGREVMGVLEVAALQPFTAEQHRVLASMSRFYRNLRGLLEENECDALTGLRNRKTFDEAFGRLTYQSAQLSLPTGDERRDAQAETFGWLAVIDIDHFKRVNDNFGHLIGDEVLLLMARLMRETFRFNDLIYRFGGEEFVVLLRSASEHDAVGAFERLRHLVAGYHFPQIERITVSVGFTRVCEDDTPTDAFDRADQAVYWVKQNGRNQVISHDQLVQGGHVASKEVKGGIDFF